MKYDIKKVVLKVNGEVVGLNDEPVYVYKPLVLINPSFKQLIEYQKKGRAFFVLVTHNLDCCINFTHINCSNMFVFFSKKSMSMDEFSHSIINNFL